MELSSFKQVERVSSPKTTLPFEVDVLPEMVKKPSGSVLPSLVKLWTSESLVITVPVVTDEPVFPLFPPVLSPEPLPPVLSPPEPLSSPPEGGLGIGLVEIAGLIRG